MAASLSLLALALALAMDAFAVSLAQGARGRLGAGDVLRIGTAFGAAQAAMPLAGWALGTAFVAVARELDHWIALVLLAYLGARMVRQGLAGDAGGEALPLAGWALAAAAVATSLDALAAGTALPAMEVPVLPACAVIGATTALLCFGGASLARFASRRLGGWAETGGGLLLIALGVKIFVEHQFFGA